MKTLNGHKMNQNYVSCLMPTRYRGMHFWCIFLALLSNWWNSRTKHCILHGIRKPHENLQLQSLRTSAKLKVRDELVKALRRTRLEKWARVNPSLLSEINSIRRHKNTYIVYMCISIMHTMSLDVLSTFLARCIQCTIDIFCDTLKYSIHLPMFVTVIKN